MRFFRIFLAAWLAIAAVYLVAITAINPRGDFAGTRLPWLYANTRRLKLNLYQKYATEKPVEIVSLGSSRTMLLDARELEAISGMRAFNFGVFSAIPEDFLAIYRWLRRTHHLPRQLLVGVDLGALGAGAEVWEELLHNRALAAELDPRLQNPFYAAAHQLRLYKSTMTVLYARDALRAVRVSLRPRTPFNTFRPDGVIEYPKWDGEISAGRFERAKAWETCAGGALNQMKVSFKDSVSSARLGVVDTLIQEATRDQVRMLLWVTPYPPEMVKRLSALPVIWQRSEEARARLDSVAQINHVGFVDLANPASFDGDPDNWYDCLHYHRADATKIAQALLGTAQVAAPAIH